MLSFQPDIIHSHHLWLVSAVARKTFTKIPMVTSCHSTDLRQFQLCPHIQERVLTECQMIDRVLALSYDQTGIISSLYNIEDERIDIVGAGFNEELFSWQERPAVETVHFLYAGKLSFSKGVEWLLRCVGKLSHLSLHLHLAGSGSGEEEKVCLELARDLGARVTIHGRLSQEELAVLMQRCHVFVLPSFYEGLPLVLLEALATGCRIITTTLPGCQELLKETSHDHVEFVELPPMRKVDSPNPEDLGILDKRLGKALEQMYQRVKRFPELREEEVYQRVEPYGWRGVFKLIEVSYEKSI